MAKCVFDLFPNNVTTANERDNDSTNSYIYIYIHVTLCGRYIDIVTGMFTQNGSMWHHNMTHFVTARMRYAQSRFDGDPLFGDALTH